MGDRYRVRWAVVRYQWRQQRMCIAERKGLLFWHPVIEAEWHHTEEGALSDIEADKELRKPFPPRRYVK